MRYEEVLKDLAPCGLSCSRCADYENGEIKQLSAKLLQLLGGYGRVAKMKEDSKSYFKGYPQFEEVLMAFTGASCSGCRGDNVLCFIDCHARNCYREKGVDFCFQCDEYPCEKQFTGGLRKRWLEKNDRMKEIGPVDFYMEQAEKPRY